MEKIKGLSVHKGEIIYEKYLIFAEIQIFFAKNIVKNNIVPTRKMQSAEKNRIFWDRN